MAGAFSRDVTDDIPYTYRVEFSLDRDFDPDLALIGSTAYGDLARELTTFIRDDVFAIFAANEKPVVLSMEFS